MKKYIKNIAIIISLLMVLSVFASCSNNEQDNNLENNKENNTQNNIEDENNVDNTQNNSNDQNNEKESEWLITDQPLTLTIHMHYQNQNPYTTSLPVLEKVEKLTNIKLENIASESAADSIETYNLMLASGDLPDIITLPFIAQSELYVKDAVDGVYMGLGSLIEQYAPNIDKVFDENPEIGKYFTVNEEDIYGLPFFYDVNAPEGMGWFIRNDWLEKLDIETPKTVDEYYNVLKAFREEDPNENGEKDEVPFFSRGMGTGQLYILWNAYESFYVENGEIKYGPLEENYKEAIINVAKWYDEKLIDPEIFTAGSAAREKLLTQNMGGSTFDWFASTSSYNERNEEIDEEFEFAAIAPPAGDDGVVRNNFHRAKIVPGALGWAMSSANEHPEETIKYFDFWFSKKGKMLANFGIEDEDYIIKNGEPVFTDNVLKADVTPIQYLLSRGAQIIGMGTMQDIRYEINVMHPLGKEGYDLYNANDWSVERYPLITYSNEDNKVVSPILANVNTYVSEMEQKWILGTSSIEDDYEEFINTLEEFEIDKVIEIQQKIYDELNQ